MPELQTDTLLYENNDGTFHSYKKHNGEALDRASVLKGQAFLEEGMLWIVALEAFS